VKLLDLFCGRWGWSRAFAARGWECHGMDLVRPSEIPAGCTFEIRDILTLEPEAFMLGGVHDFYDFIVASPPCQEFSVHGMRNFYKNPKWPQLGIKLFTHARILCEVSCTPWLMENVRPAQEFVGNAANHCGPFYLWGTGVPPIMPQGIFKGRRLMRGGYKGQTGIQDDKKAGAVIATIPPELANCVADYAEALLRAKVSV
jgi:hypothetical protein